MRLAPLVLAAALLGGCNGAAKTAVHPKAAASTPALLPAAATESPRTIAQSGTPTDLIGKTKLVSDHGAGVISNHSGGLVSDHGAGLVSDHGAGLIGKTKYALAQVAEAPLADALVEVLDGAGRRLVDEQGQAIAALSDATGAYHLHAVLPDENLVLRVRLGYDAQVAQADGQLLALLPRGQAAADVDTASSLGASYVLDQYVQGRPEVYAKLTPDLAAGLTGDVAAALVAPPAYGRADQVKAVTALRAANKPLDARLEAIKALLLAGQANNGEGLQAAKVALAGPYAVAGDAAGNLYVGEGEAGRIRKIDPAGAITRYAGGDPRARVTDGAPARNVSLAGPTGLALGPDGTLYLADGPGHALRKVAPDGTITTIAGTGRPGQGPTPGAGARTAIAYPATLALGPDGTLYTSEWSRQPGARGRILRLAPDGTLDALPDVVPGGPQAVVGLAVAADGALLCQELNGAGLYRLAPGAAAWTRLAAVTGLASYAGIAADADGTIYFAADQTGQIMKRSAAGQVSVLAGDGQRGYAGDGGPAAAARLNEPDQLWLGPDHQLYVADLGNNAVRAIALDQPGAPIRTAAGVSGVSQQGDALQIAVNGPGGLAIDPQGKLVLTEVGSATVKRLDGGTLGVLAGSTRGYNGEGKPALQAQLDTPAGVAYDGADLLILETQGNRLRRLHDGLVTTLAGNGAAGQIGHPRTFPATSLGLGRAVALAIDPADHRPYWIDNANHQLLRLNPDGNAEVVAGSLDGQAGDAGDGGPPDQALLRSPGGLAFGPDGALYLADTGNMRVRKLTGLAAGTPKIEACAGQGLLATFGALAGGAPGVGPMPAAGAVLAAPAALCFDQAGNMLVSELGTTRLDAIVASLPVGLSLDSLPVAPPRISLMTPDGSLRALTGPGTALLADFDHDDALLLPVGLVVDPQGRLVIADGGNNQIRLVAYQD